MKSRIVATLAIAAVLALGASTPALADEAYTGALSANSAAPGATVSYSADKTGQPDGTPGSYSLTGDTTNGALGSGPSFTLASSVTHTVAVGTNTQLAFSFKIPENAKPGSTYTLNVKAGTFSDTQSLKIIGVSAPLASATSGLLPLWITLAVVVLLILLAVILLAVRRSRKAGAAA